MEEYASYSQRARLLSKLQFLACIRPAQVLKRCNALAARIHAVKEGQGSSAAAAADDSKVAHLLCASMDLSCMVALTFYVVLPRVSTTFVFP
jgi:hypothetical protein